jgi:hypothetical protein
LFSLLAPAKYASVIGVSASPAFLSNLQLQGAFALMFVAAAWRCWGASKKNNLASDTYQRLSLTLAAVHGGLAAAVLSSVPGGFAALAVGAQADMVINILLAVGLVSCWATHSTRPTALIKDTFSSAGDVLTVPSNLISGLYAAATVACVYAAYTFFGASYGPNADWAAEIASSKVLAVRAAAAAALTYTLKNGADRGRLHRGTFKLINEGMAVGTAAIAYILYKGAGGTVTPIVGALAAYAALSAFEGIRAVQTAAGANSTAQGEEYAYQQIEDPLEKYCANDPSAEECKVFDD